MRYNCARRGEMMNLVRRANFRSKMRKPCGIVIKNMYKSDNTFVGGYYIREIDLRANVQIIKVIARVSRRSSQQLTFPTPTLFLLGSLTLLLIEAPIILFCSICLYCSNFLLSPPNRPQRIDGRTSAP